MNDKASILIVDDEMGMRETLSDILEDMGHHAVIAIDGYEAIQKAKENAFDIIFMDVRMPGMDGVDAFREIKKIHPEVAVVLMTAYARDDRIREAQREGAYRVLDKPLDVETLISLVEDMKAGGHAEPIPSEMPPALGQMTRVVGHDVKNKLAVMKNSVYFLTMKLGHGDEKVQKHLKILEKEIANANRIITDLMDFALVKEPVLQETNIKTVIAEALSQVPLADNWKTTTCLEDVLPPLMADASQLQRAFTNIILRIVKGVPEEGGKLQIIAGEQNGFVEVEFGAAGLNIPAENLAAAAAPFASADDINLGIAVSKRLVENNKGTIEVRRLPGRGAAFVVILPLSERGTKHGQQG